MHCTLALAPRATAGVAEIRVGPHDTPGAWVAWRTDECFIFVEAFEHEVRMRRMTGADSEGGAAENRKEATDTAIASATNYNSTSRPVEAAVAVVGTGGGATTVSSNTTGTVAAALSDPSAWPFRAVLIVDIANPFIEPLSAFKSDAVAAGAWSAALEAQWHAVRA